MPKIGGFMKSFAISVPCKTCNRLKINEINQNAPLLQIPFLSIQAKGAGSHFSMTPCTLPNSFEFQIYINRQNLNHRNS
jgi:hypothetical protein